jgi:hypothetical protein
VANFTAAEVAVLKNDGTGLFTDVAAVGSLTGASAVIALDWDADGDLDLAVANFTANTVVVLKNDPAGSFTLEDTIGTQTGASALAAGDWDGDDALDLAVANNTGGNNVKTLENTP